MARPAAPAASPSFVASVYQVKVAFEIPHECGQEYMWGWDYAPKLVHRLMDLFESTEFETDGVCNPALLIVDSDEMPTPEWVADVLVRINSTLSSFVEERASAQDEEQEDEGA